MEDTMIGKTHGFVAVASAVTILHPHQPEAILIGSGLAFLGGMTPDVDQFQSKMGRKVSKFMMSIFSFLLLMLLLKQSFQIDIGQYLPLDQFLDKLPEGPIQFLLLCSMGLNSKHRTFTHSILGMVLFALCVYLCLPQYYLYFLVGYFSHIALDLFNKEGMEIFFPIGKKFSIPLIKSKNPYANTLLVTVSFCLLAAYLFRYVCFNAF
jgi:inner membrane protein